MIRYFETFDAIGVGNDASDPLTALGWSLPGSSERTRYLSCVSGMGRNGSRALFGGNPYIFPMRTPTIPRKCNRLVLGFAVRGPGDADTIPYNQYISYPTVAPWDKRGQGTVFPLITVKFMYDNYVNFIVFIQMSRSGVVISSRTGDAGVTGYSPIAAMPYRAVPLLGLDFTFYELMLDVTDYINGIFKAAVNGVTVATQSPVVTCAHLGFGSNPYDDRAKLNRCEITISSHGYYSTAYTILDTLYLCDESGGYQDDFLGPAFSMTLPPTADGDKANWTPYVNSTVVEAMPRYQILDDTPFLPSDEAQYIEADQDLVEELMIFSPDVIPIECIPIAVNHRTATRGVATPGSPPANELVPLYKSIGNLLIETPSLMKRISGWEYQFLDIYYNVVPGFAIPWTSLIIGESQFGFLLHEPSFLAVVIEGYDFADLVAEEIFPVVTEDAVGFAEDVSDTSTAAAVWEIPLEDEFGGSEGADDGNFPADEVIAFVDALGGSWEGSRNICTGGTPTASSDYGVDYAANAFDGSEATGWHSAGATPSVPHWLAYTWPSQSPRVVPVKYGIHSPTTYFRPTQWKLQVATADGPWTTIDTRTGSPLVDGWNWFVPSGALDGGADRMRLLFENHSGYVYLREVQVTVFRVEALEG